LSVGKRILGVLVVGSRLGLNGIFLAHARTSGHLEFLPELMNVTQYSRVLFLIFLDLNSEDGGGMVLRNIG
jgi:hypothetical protein